MLKRFSKYICQSVAAMIGQSVYILADTFFISFNSGANGLAALNLILPVFGIMFAIGSMIGIGSATRYGISKAKGEDADHYFTQSISWSLVCSVPFILIGILTPDKFLALLGADAGLVELGKTYLRIVLIFAPFFMCNYSVTAFARNDNATSTVIATAFCPVVTMLVCSTHYLSKKCNIGFKWKRLSLRHLISCCQLGVSAFVGEISSAVITFIFNMLILGLTGSTGVAAYGVVANMSLVGMAIMNGMSQGAQPLISESFGKGAADDVKKLLSWALKSVVAVEIILVALVWIFTDPFIAVFNSENNRLLLEYAHTGLRLYFLGFLFAGVNIMLVAYFSATANARPAIIGSLLRGAVAIGACAIVLSMIWGMNGVWLSFLTSEIITFAVLLILGRNKESRKMNEYV